MLRHTRSFISAFASPRFVKAPFGIFLQAWLQQLAEHPFPLRFLSEN